MARHFGRRKGFFSRVREFFGVGKPPAHAKREEMPDITRVEQPSRDLEAAQGQARSKPKEGFLKRFARILGFGEDRSSAAQPLNVEDRKSEIFANERRSTMSVAEQNILFQATHRAWQHVDDPDKREQAIIDYYRDKFGLNDLDSIWREIQRQNREVLHELDLVGALDDTLSWSEQRRIIDEFYSILLNVKALSDPKLPIAPVIIDATKK